MRERFWPLEDGDLMVIALGGGLGLVWVLVGAFVALQGWLPATFGPGTVDGVAPPRRDLAGLAQILLLLPIYLTVVIASVLPIRREDVLIALALAIGILLGCLGGLLFLPYTRR